MAVVETVKAPEQFLVEVNGSYDVMFEEVEVTVAGALPSGTVLKDAATEAADIDTDVIGILADNKDAGSQWVRVMVRGNPSRVAKAELSVSSATVLASLEAKGILAV